MRKLRGMTATDYTYTTLLRVVTAHAPVRVLSAPVAN